MLRTASGEQPPTSSFSPTRPACRRPATRNESAGSSTSSSTAPIASTASVTRSARATNPRSRAPCPGRSAGGQRNSPAGSPSRSGRPAGGRHRRRHPIPQTAPRSPAPQPSPPRGATRSLTGSQASCTRTCSAQQPATTKPILAKVRNTPKWKFAELHPWACGEHPTHCCARRGVELVQ